jgi:hypothetical protein
MIERNLKLVLHFRLIFAFIVFQLTVALWAETANADMQKVDPLNAQISISDGRLVIRYSVRNGGNQPVYLTNKIVNAGMEPKLGPNNVYSRMLEGDVLEISKEMPRIAEGLSPVNLVAPFMTKLDPGAQIDEEIVLELPFLPYAEYQDNSPVRDDEDRLILQTAKSVEFVLGYFIPPEGAEAKSDMAFDVPVDNFLNPKGKRAQYGIMRSKRFSLTIPVIQTAGSIPK